MGLYIYTKKTNVKIKVVFLIAYLEPFFIFLVAQYIPYFKQYFTPVVENMASVRELPEHHSRSCYEPGLMYRD
jgi:hypothetical protein